MNKNNALLDYIYLQRWCSFKNEISAGLVEDIILESKSFDNDKKYFIIGKVLIKDATSQYFIMPLTTEKIENEASIKYDGKDCYDALKSSTYLASLMHEIN